MGRKILIISRMLTSGGAERVACNLASELSKTYDTTMLVINGVNRTYETTVPVIDMKLSIANKGFKPIWHLKVIWRTHQVKKRMHITDSISFLYEPDFANIMTGLHTRNIVSVRNKCSSERPSQMSHIRDRFVFFHADRIVALSKMVKQDLIDNYGLDEKKIITIYNPCYRDEIRLKAMDDSEITASEKAIFSDGPVVITTGRLTEQKGQTHLLNAFQMVTRACPNVKLVILGQGELKDNLVKLIQKLQLENRVFLLGYKKNPYAYLWRSDLFVFPSIFEGLGNSLIEAMACELPIVSTDCQFGPKELLDPDGDLRTNVFEVTYGQYGVLTPPFHETKDTSEKAAKEERQFADAMIRVLSDEALRNDYRKRSTAHSADFSVDDITRQWIGVIESNN